jgi:Ca2+-binding EF-hand superfamily protein
MKAGCRAMLRPIATYRGFEEEIEPKVAEASGWQNRTPEAQEFVRWLLTADPAKRPTCSEILEHPWLQMHKAENERLTQEMVHSLARYPHAPPLVRCCLYAIAARQNIPDMDRFGTAFLRIDREDKGTLSSEDLAEVLGRASMPIAINPDHVIDAADLDHSGGINFTEFVAACTYCRYVQSGSLEDLLRHAFEALDLDRDGLVSINEIRDLFRERDAPFLEHLPQDQPFDLETWCTTLQNSFKTTLPGNVNALSGKGMRAPVARAGHSTTQQQQSSTQQQQSSQAVAPTRDRGILQTPQRYVSGPTATSPRMQQPPRPQQIAVVPARQASANYGYVVPNALSASPQATLEARGNYLTPDTNAKLPAHLFTGLQQGRVTYRQPLAMVHR